jgi:molybdate transport system substrate-binding protein
MSARLSSSLLLLFGLFSSLGVAQTTLTVAAAADLAPLQPALGSSFGKNRPDIQLKWVTGASAALRQQIENGAPYDVFLSANAAYVDQLAAAQKLHPESVRAYAEGRLGLLWRDGKQHAWKDLTKPEIKVLALPNPKLAPYGVAAQQALEHLGIWPAVQPKVVYGESVRQAYQMFTSGNADAVVTAASLLGSKDATLVPANWHAPILQKAGVVASTKNENAADLFLNFLTGPDAQAVFADYGFSAPRLSDELGHKPPANP